MKLSAKLAIGMILALITLGVACWFSYSTFARLSAAQEAVSRTHEVRTILAHVRGANTQLIRLTEEFIVHGITPALWQQRRAHVDLMASITRLSSFAAADSRLRDHVRQLRSTLESRRLITNEVIEESDQLTPRSSSRPTRHLIHDHDIESLLIELEEDATRSLQTANHLLSLQTGTTRRTAIATLSATAALLLLSFVFIRRDLMGRSALETRLNETREQLQATVDRLRIQSSEIQRLGEMGSLFQQCQSVVEIYEVLRLNVPEILPYRSGVLFLTINRQKLLEPQCLWGPNPPDDSPFTPEDCWSLRRGRARLMSDSDASPECKHIHSSCRHSTLCIPMIARGESLGVLCLASPGESIGDTDTIVRLAMAVADQISLALANLRLRDRLLEQSVRDPLTSLFNRRYLEESLDRELRRAARHQRPLSVVITDVDHFKSFNTRHGHEGGDHVLREVSRILRTRIRGDDIACRFGGEEFVLILPEAGIDTASCRAEELRREVMDLELEWGGRAFGPITMSFGIAAFPDHSATGRELLAQADEALFRAKAEGRNCVRVYASSQPIATLPPQTMDSGAAAAENG